MHELMNSAEHAAEHVAAAASGAKADAKTRRIREIELRLNCG
jgi:hypothetical protein